MEGIRPQEAREPEARGLGRGGSIGQQEMEEDGDERERSGNVSLKLGRKRHWCIEMKVKRTE